MLRLVKNYLVILSAFAVLFIAGCGSSTDAPATTTGSTTTAKATTGDAATPPAKTDAPAGDAAKLVGDWSDNKKTKCTFGADGKFTMGGDDTDMSGSFIGTYTVGGDSTVLKGGKALSVTITDVQMKAKDPAKQAALDKGKPDMIKAVSAMFKDAAVKFDSDSEIEIKSADDTEPHKMKKLP